MEQSLLADVFDAHVRHEFVDKNVDATMQTMTVEPYLMHLPTLTGGDGRQAVRRFYEQVFCGEMACRYQGRSTLSNGRQRAGRGRTAHQLYA